MPLGSRKKHGTTLSGGPVCVRHTCKYPKGGKTEAPKGLTERNILEIISSDLDELIFWSKLSSTADWHP